MKNIIIDLDVFCENRWEEGMAIRGYSSDDTARLDRILHTGKGGQLWNRRIKGYIDTKGLQKELINLYPEKRSMIECYFERETEFMCLGIGAYIAVSRLYKDGYHFCLIGDMPIETAYNLEELPFFPGDCIAAVVTSGRFHAKMPSERLFEALFRQFGLKAEGARVYAHLIRPEESLFISESKAAINTAKKFGMETELVFGQEGMERLLKTL